MCQLIDPWYMFESEILGEALVLLFLEFMNVLNIEDENTVQILIQKNINHWNGFQINHHIKLGKINVYRPAYVVHHQYNYSTTNHGNCTSAICLISSKYA
jgi:hypothetical protein